MTTSEVNRNTSYHSITPSMLSKSQVAILECIRRCGDQTFEQITSKLPMKKSAVIARVFELRGKMVLTEKGSMKVHEGGKSSTQTLYGEFESPEARRTAIEAAWREKTEQRNNIVEELNNIKTAGKAREILRKEYDSLTKSINILEGLK